MYKELLEYFIQEYNNSKDSSYNLKFTELEYEFNLNLLLSESETYKIRTNKLADHSEESTYKLMLQYLVEQQLYKTEEQLNKKK